MIYLDHAATSWPKPEAVKEATYRALEMGSPGRGGYSLSQRASLALGEARARVARFLNVSQPEDVCFVPGCTHALNMVLAHFGRPGEHVVVTGWDHNSVLRPVRSLEKKGVQVTLVPARPGGEFPAQGVFDAIRPNTQLVVLNHVSNVTGAIAPVEEMVTEIQSFGPRVMLDAAQSGGVLPLDLNAMPVDFAALPGHKGLLGPPGIGVLYVRPGTELEPLWTGGTGSHSESREQPGKRPERWESGTFNLPGIMGMAAGVQWWEEWGQTQVRARMQQLARELRRGLQELSKVTVYGGGGDHNGAGFAPVVCFSVSGVSAEVVENVLDQRYGIACRGGLHCAPEMHRALGTLDQGGNVRFSLGPESQKEEVGRALEAMEDLSRRWGKNKT